MNELQVGDLVSKIQGDYRFDGWVRAVLTKRSGEVRIVVEDDRGVLFIARPDQYRRRET